MPTLTSEFSIADEIWVVDPTKPSVFHGTIIEVVLSQYNNNSGVPVDSIVYNILLDNDAGTLKSTEEYMNLLQADAMALLATLVDAGSC